MDQKSTTPINVHLMIQISILMIAGKLVGEVMKDQQSSIAKRVKYVVLPDIQMRAVPRPVVHLILGVIIITLPFMVYNSNYIYHKNSSEIC